MKYSLLLAAILLVWSADLSAQHVKKMTPQSRHRKAMHRRSAHSMHAKHYSRSHSTGMAEPPSPYHGDNTPINDGVKKNKQRNLNYNSGQPLPPSNGGR